jgi:hypothetical protein
LTPHTPTIKTNLTHQQALRLDILSTDAAGSGSGSQEEGAAVSSGELTNLLAVDAQSVLELMVFSKWEGCACIYIHNTTQRKHSSER